jgi:hypothetical protein
MTLTEWEVLVLAVGGIAWVWLMRDLDVDK